MVCCVTIISKPGHHTPDLASGILLSYRTSLDVLDSVVPVSVRLYLDVSSYATLIFVVLMIPLYVMISSSDPVGDTLRISVRWFLAPRKSLRCMFSWLRDRKPCAP